MDRQARERQLSKDTEYRGKNIVTLFQRNGDVQEIDLITPSHHSELQVGVDRV